MASIGGFFKAIGHGLKVAFGNPTSLKIEAGVVGILFPGFGQLANSAANSIIAAEGAAIAAGVQNGTGVQKFAYALSMFGPVYEAWAQQNGVTITDAHKQEFLQKIFDILQSAPEILSVVTGQPPVPAAPTA